MQRNPDEVCLVRPFCRRKDVGAKRVKQQISLIIKTKTTMEENMNLTAERSLEIITEQIAQSRKAVSKDVGQSLFVAGLCTMAMSVVVAVFNIVSCNNGMTSLGHLLWFLLPLIIWVAMRNTNKEKAPVSFVGSLVGKTWWTFAAFTIGYFILAIVWNFIIGRLCTPSEYAIVHIPIAPVIILLMAMAVSITGHILKSKWLVWFGIIGGLLVAFADTVGLVGNFLAHFYTLQTVGMWHCILPCPSVFLFALVGLTLPGWMLKKQQ